MKPLGKLVVSRSYENERTKTQISREVPVHSVLAAVLAHWFEHGWQAARRAAIEVVEIEEENRDPIRYRVSLREL